MAAKVCVERGDWGQVKGWDERTGLAAAGSAAVGLAAVVRVAAAWGATGLAVVGLVVPDWAVGARLNAG